VKLENKIELNGIEYDKIRCDGMGKMKEYF
jgi:hypothetical protein